MLPSTAFTAKGSNHLQDVRNIDETIAINVSKTGRCASKFSKYKQHIRNANNPVQV